MSALWGLIVIPVGVALGWLISKLEPRQTTLTRQDLAEDFVNKLERKKW